MTEKITKKWFVVYTKSRNEIKVSERLSALGIENYTPTKVEIRQWTDRKKKVIVPLLPSMVLVQLSEKELTTVFEVPGVVRFLFEHGKRANVSNKEVLAMKSYLEAMKVGDEKGLAVGDVVEVPLLGEQAMLLSVKGKKCLAQLQKLGAIVSFQLQ